MAVRIATLTYVNLLKEVAIAANEAVGMEDTLAQVLASVCRTMGWPLGHAYLTQGERLVSANVFYQSQALAQEGLEVFCQDSRQRVFERGVGLPGRVLASGQPAWITDTQQDDNFPRRPSTVQAGLKAGFAFPVQAGGMTLAVLEFFAYQAREPRADLLEVMAQVGYQLGLAFERQQALAALAQSEERSRRIIDSAEYAFISMDVQGRVTAWNRAAETIFGWPAAQALGRAVSQLIIPARFRQAHDAGMARLLSTGQSKVIGQRLELPALHRSGREFPIEITLWSLQEEGQWSFYSFAQDISARKAQEQKLAYQASHDALTGIPNRSQLLTWLGQRLDEAQSGSNTAVLFVDLDHFKRINDSYGHDAGDKVLVEVSRRLTQTLRGGDRVGRLAGDEFVIVCAEVADHQQAGQLALRLQQALAKPIGLREDKVYVSASIGVALADQACSPQELITLADIAMYEAKARGRGSIQLFDQQMQVQVESKLALENDLYHALSQNEFRLYFQPIICARLKRVVSFEVLLRWQHPGKGLLGPADFIPVAEEAGLIVPMGLWVIEEACRLVTTSPWLSQLEPPLGININLSARQLLQPDLVEQIKAILDRAGLEKHQVVFGLEVTETAMMTDPDLATQNLEGLKALGVRISIDDFGTGYSSLAYLKQFPIDTLKIDRSFVASLSRDPVDQAIVQSVTSLARALELTVVAEGVESAAQEELLRDLGVDLLQGYHYARPMPLEQLRQLVEQQKLSMAG